MTKSEIRRRNLQHLIDTEFNGKIANFARAINYDGSYISRCLYPPDKPNSKKVGEAIIDRIVDILHKPPGWIDVPQWLPEQSKNPIEELNAIADFLGIENYRQLSLIIKVVELKNSDNLIRDLHQIIEDILKWISLLKNEQNNNIKK